MIGYRPSLYMKCCWKFITPAICTVSKLFVFSYDYSIFQHLNMFLTKCFCNNKQIKIIMVPFFLIILFLCTVHIASLPDQVYTNQIQQLPVPMVGLRSRDILSYLFYSLLTCVGDLRFVCNTWRSETGNEFLSFVQNCLLHQPSAEPFFYS